MMMRRLSLLLIVGATAGCYDFVEPDFPEAGAPAVLSASMFVDEFGNANFDGLLAPGLAIGGVSRPVPNDTIYVMGVKIAPGSIAPNRSRSYHYTGSVITPRRFTMQAPSVEGVGTPPGVDWFGMQKTDADTLFWTPGTTLTFHVRTNLGPSTPAPPIRQWFLELRGDRSVRISSDGLPPDTLPVPPNFIPTPVNGVVVATLSLYQSGTQQQSHDYIGSFTYNFSVRWIVRVKT